MTNKLLSQVYLTNQNKTVCKEIEFRLYRNFLKCLLGDSINYDLLFLNLNNILEHCLVDPTLNINELNYIDYIILLLSIRSLSLGDTVNLQLKSNKEDVNVSVDLNNINNLLLNIDYNFLLSSTNIKNLIVKYKLPTITEVLHIEKNNTYFYNFFIDTITINNNEINFKKLSYSDQDILLQQISAKHFSTIVKKIETILNFLKNINFFDSVYDEILFNIYLPILPNAQNISQFLKLIFNSNLDTIYSNIFALIKAGNFTGDFIDCCSPGEFFVFCKKLEAFNKEQIQNNENDSNKFRSFGLQDLPPTNKNAFFTLE